MTLSHLKTLTVVFAVALILGSTVEVSAVNRNWRLNPDESAKADFVSIKAAMDDERVIPGDILILDPGYYDEETSITKDNITICGSGYLLSQNYDYSESAHAIVRGLHFKANNIAVKGLHINEISITGNYINNSIYRCHFRLVDSSRGQSADNMTIEESFINGIGCIVFNSCTFRNNIILGSISYWNSPEIHYDCKLEYNTIIHSGNNDNNGFGIFKNSVIKNNIIINKDESKDGYCAIGMNTSYNNEFTNNVFSTPEEEADKNYTNNKYVGATVENTFVDEIIADRYYIREGSIALKAAGDGGQCGAFGGRSPYVLSGILDYMPHITEVQIPAKPTDNKLNVKLKIAIRDE